MFSFGLDFGIIWGKCLEIQLNDTANENNVHTNHLFWWCLLVFTKTVVSQLYTICHSPYKLCKGLFNALICNAWEIFDYRGTGIWIACCLGKSFCYVSVTVLFCKEHEMAPFCLFLFLLIVFCSLKILLYYFVSLKLFFSFP